MDIQAHNILRAVIADQGTQLATSNAYCKVYLAGHMIDYPEEKQKLVALKTLELPKALLDFNGTLLPESDLVKFILKLAALPHIDKDSVAWGVDAWAAALDINEEVRREIRKQCFPDVSPRLNTDPEYYEVEGMLKHLEMTSTAKARSPIGKVFKTTVASVAGLMALTVFGGNTLDTHTLIESGADTIQTLSKTPPQSTIKPDEIVAAAPKLELQKPLTTDPLNILKDPTASLTNKATLVSFESIRSDYFTASDSAVTLDKSELPRSSLVNLTPLIIQEDKHKKMDFKVVQYKPVKAEVSQRVSQAPVSIFNPKTIQLNANIEFFLMNGN